MIVLLGAVAIAGIVAAYAAALAGRFGTELAAAGALACLMLAGSLCVASPLLIPWSLAVLAAEYGAALLLRGGSIDGRAPIVAAALVLVGELSYFTLQLRALSALHDGLFARHLIRAVGAAVATGAATALLLAFTDARPRGGVLADAIGIAALIGAFAVIAALARARRE